MIPHNRCVGRSVIFVGGHRFRQPPAGWPSRIRYGSGSGRMDSASAGRGGTGFRVGEVGLAHPPRAGGVPGEKDGYPAGRGAGSGRRPGYDLDLVGLLLVLDKGRGRVRCRQHACDGRHHMGTGSAGRRDRRQARGLPGGGRVAVAAQFPADPMPASSAIARPTIVAVVRRDRTTGGRDRASGSAAGGSAGWGTVRSRVSRRCFLRARSAARRRASQSTPGSFSAPRHSIKAWNFSRPGTVVRSRSQSAVVLAGSVGSFSSAASRSMSRALGSPASRRACSTASHIAVTAAGIDSESAVDTRADCAVTGTRRAGPTRRAFRRCRAGSDPTPGAPVRLRADRVDRAQVWALDLVVRPATTKPEECL